MSRPGGPSSHDSERLARREATATPQVGRRLPAPAPSDPHEATCSGISFRSSPADGQRGRNSERQLRYRVTSISSAAFACSFSGTVFTVTLMSRVSASALSLTGGNASFVKFASMNRAGTVVNSA